MLCIIPNNRTDIAVYHPLTKPQLQLQSSHQYLPSEHILKVQFIKKIYSLAQMVYGKKTNILWKVLPK